MGDTSKVSHHELWVCVVVTLVVLGTMESLVVFDLCLHCESGWTEYILQLFRIDRRAWP